jgi:hypothetical protein
MLNTSRIVILNQVASTMASGKLPCTTTTTPAQTFGKSLHDFMSTTANTYLRMFVADAASTSSSLLGCMLARS